MALTAAACATADWESFYGEEGEEEGEEESVG